MKRKLDQSKIYTNSKSIQFVNGNILVLSSSTSNSVYNLEGFIYKSDHWKSQFIGY